MIDIHSHIIPHFDDGSDSLDCTFRQVLREMEHGVTSIFATPHSAYIPDNVSELYTRFDQLKQSLNRRFRNVHIYLGCEIMCCRQMLPDILQKLENRQLPTMNQTKCILTEFPDWITFSEMKECLVVLLHSGWYPILAHAERYNCLDSISDVQHLREMGCLIQINIYSLEDYAEKQPQLRARQFILRKLVSFLGTDTHTMTFRPPSIEQGMLWLGKNCTQEYIHAICHQNAAKLLLNEA